MFLSKIWFVLVGLLAGVATTAAFVAPRSADRKIVELEGQRLDRAQYAADQMLKTDAHQWIDYTAKLSRDAVLAESLDAATRGAGEARLVQETVRNRLKTLVPDLKGIGLESVAAVDARGRLTARIGEREGDAGEPMAGLEVVGDALRGYLSDDVWGFGGKLRRVAAVPVLSKTRDKVVGAVYVAAESGKRLAEVWKQNLGVEIAVLLRGQVLTSTVPESYLSNLAAQIEERAGELAQHKRTRPIPLKVGSDRLLAVAAPFQGMAGDQKGYYILIGKMSPASDPLALLSTTTADDLGMSNFPWLGLAAGLVVILGVGLFLPRLEMERPLSRLRTEVQRLSRGEIHKLDDHVFPGKFGGIARDVNAAMERFTLASPPRSETAKKDLDAILGQAPKSGEPSSVFDLPQSHYGAGMAPASPFAPRPPSGAGAPPGFAPPGFAPPGFAPPPFAPPPFASPGMAGASGGPSAFGGGGGPGLGGAGSTTPAPVPFGSPGFGASQPGAAQLGALPERRLNSPSLGSNGPRTPAVPPRIAESSALAGGPPMFGGPPPSPSMVEALDTAEELPGRVEDLVGPEDGAAYDEHIRGVFEEYRITRQRCGESTATLSLEKFQAKLEANRQQLIAKYGCRTARFSVYVKDGKAAIKATPVR
jgi:hypothetical protein